MPRVQNGTSIHTSLKVTNYFGINLNTHKGYNAKTKEITFDGYKHQTLPAVEILPLIVPLHQFNRRGTQLGKDNCYILIRAERERQEKPIVLGNTAVTTITAHGDIERSIDRNIAVSVAVKLAQIFDGREILESRVGNAAIGVSTHGGVGEIMGQDTIVQAIAAKGYPQSRSG